MAELPPTKKGEPEPEEEAKGEGLATEETLAGTTAAGSTTSAAAATGVEEGEKKKKTVRMSQAQVDSILACTLIPLPAAVPAMCSLSEDLKGVFLESLGGTARLLRQPYETCLAEQERVRREVEEKVYMEIKVDEDEVGEDGAGADEEDDDGGRGEVVVPRRGRRRCGPGVRKDASAA